MIIYVDVLLALNLFVNYFLLLSSALLSQQKPRRLRCLLGAFVGSLSSLIILLPDMGFLVTILVKLALGALLVLLVFGWKSRAVFVKTLLIFWAANFIFAGVMFGVWLMMSPAGMFWQNGVTYVAISPIVLIAGSVAAYLCICLVHFALSRRVSAKQLCRISAYVEQTQANVTALVDTGNRLTDPFSGLPVCVWEYSAACALIPSELEKFFCDPAAYPNDLERSEWRKRVRLIPCETVGGKSLLPAFLPDRCTVETAGSVMSRQMYIAITPGLLSDGEFHAIVGNLCEGG